MLDGGSEEALEVRDLRDIRADRDGCASRAFDGSAVSRAAFSLFEKLTTTLAPREPYRSAIAFPMPRADPVTRATFPRRFAIYPTLLRIYWTRRPFRHVASNGTWRDSNADFDQELIGDPFLTPRRIADSHLNDKLL
jgi:hypothetical protein